jgi:hypothetical protein
MRPGRAVRDEKRRGRIQAGGEAAMGLRTRPVRPEWQGCSCLPRRLHRARPRGWTSPWQCDKNLNVSANNTGAAVSWNDPPRPCRRKRKRVVPGCSARRGDNRCLMASGSELVRRGRAASVTCRRFFRGAETSTSSTGQRSGEEPDEEIMEICTGPHPLRSATEATTAVRVKKLRAHDVQLSFSSQEGSARV